MSELKVREKQCEKDGCTKTFVPGPRQRRRLYCDEHFIGHKSGDRKKNTHRATWPRTRTVPVKEKQPAVLRGFIGGVEPKILSHMSVVSDAMVQIDFTDDSLTFRSPGIRLVIGK